MLQVPFSHFACYNLTIYAYFCENGRRFIVIQYYMGLGKSDYVIYGWGGGSGILLLGLYMNISNFKAPTSYMNCRWPWPCSNTERRPVDYGLQPRHSSQWWHEACLLWWKWYSFGGELYIVLETPACLKSHAVFAHFGWPPVVVNNRILS